jgi:hypothetical protein
MLAPALASAPGVRLEQPVGRAGCLGQAGTTHCTPVSTWDDDADALAITPDGRHAYLMLDDDRLIALARNRSTGRLREVAGGCAATGPQRTRCAPLRHGTFPMWSGLLLALDGRNAYVSDEESGVLALHLDRRTGAPRQLAGRAGCVGHRSDCRPVRGGTPTDGSVMTPDGRDVLLAVSGAGGTGLIVLRRDRRDGSLRPLAGRGGCLLTAHRSSCARLRNVSDILDVAISPDGRTVLVSDNGGDGHAVLARDPRSGSLRQLPGASGCLGGSGRCRELRGNHDNGFAAFVGDRRVIVATRDASCDEGSTGDPDCVDSGGLVVLARDPGTGRLTQPAGRFGCLSPDGEDGCARADWFDDEAAGLVVGPEGTTVAVEGRWGIRVLTARGAGSGLRPLDGPGGCFGPAANRCGGGDDFAIRPDGRAAYSLGAGILALTRDPITGALTPAPPRLRLRGAGAFPRLTLSADGRSAYVLGDSGLAILGRAG